MGDDPLCRVLTAEEKLQCSTPTYKSCKEHQKISEESPSLVDSETVKLLGKVESGQVVQDTTPASKKKTTSSVTTPTKARKKKSSKTSSYDLKALDNKWLQKFARLEAMLLANSFLVLVEPVNQMSTTIVIIESSLFLQ